MIHRDDTLLYSEEELDQALTAYWGGIYRKLKWMLPLGVLLFVVYFEVMKQKVIFMYIFIGVVILAPILHFAFTPKSEKEKFVRGPSDPRDQGVPSDAIQIYTDRLQFGKAIFPFREITRLEIWFSADGNTILVATEKGESSFVIYGTEEVLRHLTSFFPLEKGALVGTPTKYKWQRIPGGPRAK
jgi:hypothetical protein